MSNQSRLAAVFAELKKAPRIEFAEFDGANLSIRGSGWSFNTLASWRLVRQNRIAIGCEDKGAADAVKSLVGLKVESVGMQAHSGTADPAFHLDNDSILEVFGSSTTETWTLSTNKRHIVSVGSSWD